MYSCLFGQTRTHLHITLHSRKNWRSITICTLGYQFQTLQKKTEQVSTVWSAKSLTYTTNVRQYHKPGSRNTKGCHGIPGSRNWGHFPRGPNTISHKNHHRFHPLHQYCQTLKSTVKFHAIYPIHVLTMNSANRWIKELFSSTTTLLVHHPLKFSC